MRAPTPIPAFTLTAALLAALPAAAAGQATLLFRGRVVEAGLAAPIQNATVELDGYPATLTDAEGAFRIADVKPGGRTLRVVAYGYAPKSQFVIVGADSVLTVALDIDPIPLDPVTFHRLDVRGRVRDPARRFSLVDAEVLTNEGQAAETDSHGYFRLKGVLEEVPLHISVHAFGYLAVDTVVTPRRGGSYSFELVADPLVQEMIAAQVERLAARASANSAVTFRDLPRDRLLRYAGSHTLLSLLETEYNQRGSFRCMLVDEVELHPDVVKTTLATMLPEEVERIEVLFEGAMVRIYTRAFIEEMTARELELREPSLFSYGGARPLCT